MAEAGKDDGPAEALVDTHVHFWDHSIEGFHWPWLEPGFSYRKVTGTDRLDAPRFTTPEFRAEIAGAGVAGLVVVHAAERMPQPERETAWLEGMAEEHGWPDAIVGGCELRRPDAPDVLRRHAGFSRLRSVRDMWGASLLEDPDELAPAFTTAAELGVSVELSVSADRFPVFRRVAEAWPSLTLVLSRAGLPEERSAADLAEWRAAVRDVARAPNLVCKVYAVAGSSDPDWTVQSIRPWILEAIEAFGPDRCMLGTNWPIDRLVARYHDLVDAYREVVSELDAGERAAVFRETAARVYRLADAATGRPAHSSR